MLLLCRRPPLPRPLARSKGAELAERGGSGLGGRGAVGGVGVVVLCSGLCCGAGLGGVVGGGGMTSQICVVFMEESRVLVWASACVS